MYVCVCMCGSVGDSVSVVALDTHHHPPSRQYSRSLSTSSLVLHHITKPALVASRCCSLLLFDLHLHLLHQSTCLTFAINQSINHSIILERDSMQHVSLSAEWRYCGLRERERERERENVVVVVVVVLLHPECACVTILPTLSLNRDPPNQAHNVCV